MLVVYTFCLLLQCEKFIQTPLCGVAGFEDEIVSSAPCVLRATPWVPSQRPCSRGRTASGINGQQPPIRLEKESKTWGSLDLLQALGSSGPFGSKLAEPIRNEFPGPGPKKFKAKSKTS